MPRRNLLSILSKRGGSPPWKPTDIPGCVMWFDASQIVGLVDGDPITTWPDLAGGHDAIGSGASRPTYRIFPIPGLPVVQGDGADVLTTTPNHQIGTIFAALGNIGNFGYNGWGCVNTNRRFMLMSGSNRYLYSGDGNDLFYPPNLTYYIDSVLTYDMGDTGYHIVTLVGDEIWETVTTLSLFTSIMNGSITGDACEFIFYDTILDASNRAIVETYLLNKWNQPLPSNYAIYDNYADANAVTLPNHIPNKAPVGATYGEVGPLPIATGDIQGNKLRIQDTGDGQVRGFTIESGVTDCTISFSFYGNFVSPAAPSVCFRDDGTDYFMAWAPWFFGTAYLYDPDGTLLDSGSWAAGADDVIQVTVTLLGTTITVEFKNITDGNSRTLTGTSTKNQTATKHGPGIRTVWGGGAYDYFDNFSVVI